jgi:hypothetical protein
MTDPDKGEKRAGSMADFLDALLAPGSLAQTIPVG